jgi:hypothetical protein
MRIRSALRRAGTPEEPEMNSARQWYVRLTMAKLPAKTVLSVRQPWAWLLVHGYKDIENRDWQTNFRGNCLIHAGKTFDYDGYQWVKRNFKIRMPKPADFHRGGIIGWVRVVDCVRASESPWFFGKYGFVVEAGGELPFIPLRGRLRFFDIDETDIEFVDRNEEGEIQREFWPDLAEEDSGESLVRQLQAYKRYRELSRLLEEREARNLRTYRRGAPRLEVKKHDEICFSAFHPKEARVNKWYTLLVYAHLDSIRDAVRWDAAKFDDEMGKPKEAKAAESTRLPRGTPVTIIPYCKGLEFNPDQVTFRWEEDMHRATFRFCGDPSLAGDAASGQIAIYANGLVIGTIKLALLFCDAGPAPVDREQQEAGGRMFLESQIFISYSHKDKEIVKLMRDFIRGLGYRTLIDIDELRAAQIWDEALMAMIERADIFQLFWSKNAAISKFVQKEWRHALKCRKLLVPVYWQKPLFPEPPEELSAIQFGYLPIPELKLERPS